MSKTFRRRKTHPVHIGHVTIGGDNPVAVQSMTNTKTMDTEASVAQILSLAEAGADIVRLTAQTSDHARNLGTIREKVRQAGCEVPLVADIHFNPAAAFVAAENVEKVRINPGNFVDPGRTFVKLEFTDDEYAAELERLRQSFVPLLDLCRSRGVALRIGVNHGSLSDRIMSRYGDTPAGMVESAMEFLRVCMSENFTDVVISIKASNVVVMTETVRLLCDAMAAEGMDFPLHLGVTEAGDGEDGRIKSAVGIGSLLADGIGDTIRVSLSEAPENEIPVARRILRHIELLSKEEAQGVVDITEGRDAEPVPLVTGFENVPEGLSSIRVTYPADLTADEVQIAASIDLGSRLLERPYGSVEIVAPSLTAEECRKLALDILQATRRRISKTEYIACPGCGRTLFDLHTTLSRVKESTAQLKGLKIGVMGCIVNGPGEMADADYGYVGAGPGRVSIYRGKECVYKNIPTDEALPMLLKLIANDGRLPE
ncbi:MAG: (E)-4-hydroxy-3-methylbut-2-enyl-diphosphate synthase [Muribaculaceae bacterium]|nr:(E)-4-hydroxy-3-methylbut-2-enyl-diphosphate synthase [Muribaculaceae bacterium]